MEADDIRSIGVIGAGNMGQQIALLCALGGYKVTCQDISEAQLGKAASFAGKYLSERVAKGKLTEEETNKAQANLFYTISLEEAVKEADFVIEAAAEKLDIKREIFKKLDRICPDHTIIVTNSSYILSSEIAGVTKRSKQICNMHFFNPALIMKCVEVVKGSHTSNETVRITMDISRNLSKEPVLLQKEIYGFLVNRILQKIRKEALFLHDIGVASTEDIDKALETALGHPMGPFRLMDLTGIDLAYHVFMERYKDTYDPDDKPSPTVVKKYVKGDLGKKTGKGFYDYN